jgi:hypothetical protein
MRRGGSKPDGLRRVLASAIFVAATLVARDALAYGEQGFYTGAFATNGESLCTGMGINPTGGCTPGVDALVLSEAFNTGIQGPANYADAIADLALGRLVARSIFPDGFGNSAQGVANLTETFTVLGDLPSETTLRVEMRVRAVVADNAGGDGTALVIGRLTTDAPVGSGNSYFYRSTNCAIAGGNPCSTQVGWVQYDVVRTVSVDDANRSFRVDAELAANGSGGSPRIHSTDAWARILVFAPEGLVYDSASGVFPPAPEPTASALSLTCVASLAAARRVRSAKPPTSPP